MEDAVPFGGLEFNVTLALLLFARGMDFLSTWVATPNLVLEANPVAKLLGWKWGAVTNLALCFLAAFFPLAAIVIITTSLLVAARNFKSAWVMRALGEERYRFFMSDLLEQTRLRLFLLCLAGETLLTALVGAALMWFCDQRPVVLAIGLGIVAYALAVAFYTLLSVWRMWRKAG